MIPSSDSNLRAYYTDTRRRLNTEYRYPAGFEFGASRNRQITTQRTAADWQSVSASDCRVETMGSGTLATPHARHTTHHTHY